MMKSPVWTIDAYYDFLGSLSNGHDGEWEKEEEKKKKKCMCVDCCVLPFIVLKKKMKCKS